MLPLEPFFEQSKIRQTEQEEQERQAAKRAVQSQEYPIHEGDTLESYVTRLKTGPYRDEVEHDYLDLLASANEVALRAQNGQLFSNHTEALVDKYKTFRPRYVEWWGARQWSRLSGWRRIYLVITGNSPEDEINSALLFGGVDTTFRAINHNPEDTPNKLDDVFYFLQTTGELLNINVTIRRNIEALVAKQVLAEEQRAQQAGADSAEAGDGAVDQTSGQG